MPPKKRFTKDDIVEAAFEITREEGWASVTARSIAHRLTASTQPVYSYLESMQQIEDEVRLKALGVLIEYQKGQYTDNPFLNMAIGYVKFAQGERLLFRFFYLERSRPLNEQEQIVANQVINELLGKGITLGTYSDKISSSEMDDITLKSWLFTHGLAVALSTGSLTAITEEEIIRLLSELGGALIVWRQTQNARLTEKDE